MTNIKFANSEKRSNFYEQKSIFGRHDSCIGDRAGLGKHDITVGLLSNDQSLDGWYKATVDVSPSGSCVKVTEERNSGYKVGLQALFC